MTLTDALSLARSSGQSVGGRGRIEAGRAADLARFACDGGDSQFRIDEVWTGDQDSWTEDAG